MIGFFAGTAVLIVLGALLPEEDDHGHGDDDKDDKAEAAPMRAGSLRGGVGASRKGWHAAPGLHHRVLRGNRRGGSGAPVQERLTARAREVDQQVAP